MAWPHTCDSRNLLCLERRYYGQSKPFKPKQLRNHMAWLTSEQVLCGAGAGALAAGLAAPLCTSGERNSEDAQKT